ncbi:sigma-70 family RNA polymerase sigma factor [Desulfatirhabdium butyrativorans]|uniref:sigma-70 family RNA polymerase sigma factor n=1 Tax=Desulfatirhabdium butyrativorans TaxID=340467 RepID=UPI0004163690|nr:sigma-70 family RNA polymerase sigma factor [Desulfatirhabdium butyrativorans]
MSFDCVLGAWQAHEKEIRAYLDHQVSDPMAADDLLHEVFLKAMKRGAGFCELNNPRAWLFQVTRTTLIDHARLAKPFVEIPEDLPMPDAEEEHPAVDDLKDCLGSNLVHLSDDDRAIVEACDLQGMTVRAFAERHGLGLAAAKSRLLRARRRLRDLLVQNCHVRFDASGNVCCHIPHPIR